MDLKQSLQPQIELNSQLNLCKNITIQSPNILYKGQQEPRKSFEQVQLNLRMTRKEYEATSSN